jgi:hypothetical protein
MKLRLNKKVLAEMPAPVRSFVIEWRYRWHKNFISVVNRSDVPMQEDAKVTVINLLTGAHRTERVAGEFAGMTKLSPTDNLQLPAGCVAVVTGIFLGHPWLTIYQSEEHIKARLQLSGNMIRLVELHQQDAIEGRMA